MISTLRRGLAGAVALVALAACAPSSPGGAASPGGGRGSSRSAASDTTAAAFPMTVQNCGRKVTIDRKPTRIVGTEGAAETVFALDAADQMAGYFGGAPGSLPANLASQAKKTQYLGASFPFPSAEQVLKNKPDLVVLYGFGDSGSLAKQLDAQQVPYLVLSETCDHPNHTVSGYFGDVKTIATAIGRPEAGAKLVDRWTAELPRRTTPAPDAPKVVIYGNMDPSKPFVSAGDSFAQDQMDYAGAVNVYGDVKKAYLEPSWEDIASRKPDIIFSGGGGGEKTRQGIEKYLKNNAALDEMPAVKNNRIITLDYAKNVPGPQAIEGIKEIHAAVVGAS